MCRRVTPVSLKIFQNSLILLAILSTVLPTTSLHLVFTKPLCEDGQRHVNLSLSPLSSTWGWTQNALWKGFLLLSLGSDKKVHKWWVQSIHLHFPIPYIQLWQDQSCPSSLHQNTDKEGLYKSFLTYPASIQVITWLSRESLPRAHLFN